MTEIAVRELGRTIAYSFEDLLKYHGPGSPGGVAHAFKVMERAFGLLSPDEPPQRREIAVRTSFGGPGARDGFEAVTRRCPAIATRSMPAWRGPSAAASSSASSSS